MEPDRGVADLEVFLADRGDHLLRTAVLLTGGKEARWPPATGSSVTPGGNTVRLTSIRLSTLAGARAFSTCRRT